MAATSAPSASASSDPRLATALYRQNVSLFLSQVDAALGVTRDDDALTSWVGDASRSLALRAASSAAQLGGGNDDADAPSGRGKKGKKRAAATVAAEASGGAPRAEEIIRRLPHPSWSDFVCMTCGTFLFPPDPTSSTAALIASCCVPTPPAPSPQTPSLPPPPTSTLPCNIYTRPLKRGRTRRRRASRSKAKELHDRALALQRRGGSSNAGADLRRDALLEERTRRVASSHRLGDGRARNCLVMKCARCGARKRRKGVEAKGAPKKGDGSAVGGGGAAATKVASGNISSGKKRKDAGQPLGKARDVASQIHENSDYISLSSLGGGQEKNARPRQHDAPQQAKDVQPRKRKQGEVGKESALPPLLGGSSKKKKKKKNAPESKKRGLMDFLSSLND